MIRRILGRDLLVVILLHSDSRDVDVVTLSSWGCTAVQIMSIIKEV